MAISTSHLIVFLSIAIVFAPSTLATNYTVGDSAGWNVGVNYTDWVQNKAFYVGDYLIFNYPAGDHNVYRVNGNLFHNCTIPSDQTPFNTGNDAILLKQSGRRWYICGEPDHCAKNQKLVLTVMDMAPANSPLPGGAGSMPPPPPSSSATRAGLSAQFGFVLVVVAILGMMMAS